jgi:hypothetical protein
MHLLSDQLGGALPRHIEADLAAVELVQFSQPVLSEISRLEVETGGDQLHKPAARILAPRGQAAEVCVGDAATGGVSCARQVRERPDVSPRTRMRSFSATVIG